MIYLTASLPKRLESRFMIEACLPPDTLIIRAPSDQPQISYNKLNFNNMNTDVIRLAVDVAQIMTTVMGPKRKGIIFCSTIAEADVLGAKIAQGCISHSKLPTKDKTANEARWKAGDFQWIAATTGLICGIDEPNVGAIIFVGLGYGLVNLYQGGGRSGRDKTPSWTIVLRSLNTHLSLPKNGIRDDPQCIQESDDWRLAEECRRIGFSSLFDNARVTCFDLQDAHFCDFCKPDSELLAILRSKIIDPLVQRPVEDNYDSFDCDLMNIDFEGIPELSGVRSSTPSYHYTSSEPTASTSSLHLPTADPFRFAPTPGQPSMQIERRVAYYHALLSTKEEKSRALNAFTTMLFGKCPLCWAYQGILVPRHKGMWIQCRGPQGKGFMAVMYTVWAFKKKIKFPKYQFCWKCHLPQDKDFMPPSHPNYESGDRGSKQCPHEDLVVLLVLFIRQDREGWWRRACDAFGLASNISEEDFVKWYTAEDVRGGFNNSLELILWFYMEKERERKRE